MFLIAKNQIMHLQTFTTVKSPFSEDDTLDHFKALSKFGSSWYMGGFAKTNFNNLLRRIVFA